VGFGVLGVYQAEEIFAGGIGGFWGIFTETGRRRLEKVADKAARWGVAFNLAMDMWWCGRV
jgi:hypothetical protein